MPIPLDFSSLISSNKAQGSTTTPLPIIEILFFLTIPEGNNFNYSPNVLLRGLDNLHIEFDTA